MPEKPEELSGSAPPAISVQGADEIVRTALSSDIPQLYFNGFALVQGTGDVAVVLQRNSQPVAVVNCSFTLAKTLSEKLRSGIVTLEDLSGRSILTTEDIARLISDKARKERD